VVVVEESVTLQPVLVMQSLKLHVVQVVAGENILLVFVVVQVDAVFFEVQLSSPSSSPGSAPPFGHERPTQLPPRGQSGPMQPQIPIQWRGGNFGLQLVLQCGVQFPPLQIGFGGPGLIAMVGAGFCG
jgi:hypothetical protein